VLVAAVLRPQEREDGQLEAVRVALEQPADTFQLPIGEPEGAVQRLFRNCRQSYFSLTRALGAIGPAAAPSLA
jgi:hypothetical protein